MDNKKNDKNNKNNRIKTQRIILSFPFEGTLEIPEVNGLNPLDLQISMSSYLSLFALVLGKCAVDGKVDFANFVRHMTEAVINHRNGFDKIDSFVVGHEATDEDIIEKLKDAIKKQKGQTEDKKDIDNSNEEKFKRFLEQRDLDSFNQQLTEILKENKIPFGNTKDKDV